MREGTMIYMSTILSVIFFLATPLVSSEAESPKNEWIESKDRLGKEVVAAIRSDYENGKFNGYLLEMEEAYSKADLKELMEARAQGSIEDVPEDWERRFSDLRRERNKNLIQSLSEDDRSLFASKVRSVAIDLLSSEQEEAVSKVNSLISMAPNNGKNVDENVLIDIDMEYEYRLLKGELLDPKTKESKQIALRMEKMDKMLTASKSFENPILKKAVATAHATLDARLARNLDGADLHALSKKKPQNESQELVFSILKSYQGQFSDIYRK